MKKLFILLVMFFIALGTQSKEQVCDSTVTAQVNPTVVYFTEKLESLAKSLQVPAEHVYKVLVQREVLNAWSILITILLCYIIAGIILKITLKFYNNKNRLWRLNNSDSYHLKEDPNYSYYTLDEDWWIVGVIVSGVIFVITLICTLCYASDITIGLFNPEYGAIKEIMNLF